MLLNEKHQEKNIRLLRNENAKIKPFLNPILSPIAPTKGGKKYNKAKKTPATTPVALSSNPTTSVKYKVNTIKKP